MIGFWFLLMLSEMAYYSINHQVTFSSVDESMHETIR